MKIEITENGDYCLELNRSDRVERMYFAHIQTLLQYLLENVLFEFTGKTRYNEGNKYAKVVIEFDEDVNR